MTAEKSCLTDSAETLENPFEADQPSVMDKPDTKNTPLDKKRRLFEGKRNPAEWGNVRDMSRTIHGNVNGCRLMSDEKG